MTHNEINSCSTRSTDKYSTVIDKTTRCCLKGSKYNGRTVWYLKTSSVPIFAPSAKNRSRTPHPRSKNSFYCKAVSKPYPITKKICKKVRQEFERNRYPIFGGLSPKWQAATLGTENAIEIFSLNTTMID